MPWRLIRHFSTADVSGAGATGHLQGPVAIQRGDAVRVYYAARGPDGRSFPTFFDLDVNDLQRVRYSHDRPVTPWGPRGAFDDDGDMPACALDMGEHVWMYYSGWNRRVSVPYHNTIGLAVSDDDGRSFRRMFDGPIMDRTPLEPFMAVTPWVMRTAEGWRMWYVGGKAWVDVDGRLEPTYGIRHATSTDGIAWTRSGRFVIPMRHEEEAIARPTVLVEGDRFHMWYSYRDSRDFRDGKGSYRIGYAYSNDGENWVRADRLAGMPPSNRDWDRHMQCYPYVLPIAGRLHLFYNGNGFGQGGVGLAIWEGPLPRP
jgi:hypothetical protein